MPTSIIAMAVGAAVSSAVASSIGVGFISAMAGGLASAAFNAAFASTPDQPQPMQQQLTDNLVTVRQPISNWQYIYGRAPAAGALTFAHESADQNFHLVITYAGHICTEIETVQFNDEIVPLDADGNATGKYAGFVRVKKSLGDEAGQPFADLVAESEGKWTDAHRQSGRTKIYVRLTPNADLFPTGIPNIKIVAKGKKVYDPRTGLTAWSDNASLCQADYVCDVPAGLEAVYADEIDNAQLIAAANIDDETVSIMGGGSEKRYTLNGTFLVDSTPGNVLGRLLTANAGKVRYIGGLFMVQPAAYVTPTITLTEDDCRAVPHIIPRLSAADLCNGVKGLYVSEDNLWQPSDFPPVTNATYLAEDEGERAWLELNLPYTKSSATAQRIAKIELERRRQQITVEWKGKFNCYRLQAGNTGMLSFAMMGWSGKVFDVEQSGLVFEDDNNGGVRLGADLVLRETAAGVYDWNSGEETVVDLAPDTNLPDPFAVTPPTDLVLSDAPLTLQDGTVIPRIAATWTPSGYAFTTGWEVRWKIAGASEWQTQTVTDPAVILQPLSVGDAYDIEIRTLTPLGKSQTALTASGHVALGQVNAPPAPTSLTATGGMFQISLAWTLNVGTRRDIRHTEVWASLTNDRATAARITCAPWPDAAYDHIGLSPGQHWFYWVRLEDTSGNHSTYYPSSATNGATGTPSADPTDLLTQLKDAVGLTELVAELAAPIALISTPDTLAMLGGMVAPPADVAGPSPIVVASQAAAESLLNLLVKADSLKAQAQRDKWILDATSTVDPVTGTVTLLATAAITTDVEAHLIATDLTLDGMAGSIISHTSTLGLYGTRITDAETNITQLEGDITLKASSTYVDTTIAAALGAIDPANVATMTQLGAEGLLSALVDGDATRKDALNAAVRMALAETTLSTHSDAISAEAVARTVLFAQVASNAAAITNEQTARANADSAEAALRVSLAATVSGNLATTNAAISNEAIARANADSAEAGLRVALAAVVNNPTTGLATRAAASDVTNLQTLTGDATHGNTALATRTTNLETSVNSGTTGLATRAAASDVTNLQTLTGDATHGNTALASSVSTLTSSVSTAQSTANTGVSNAATAQSTANTAVSDAAAAASTANTVQARLDTGDYAAVKTESSANASAITGIQAKYALKVDVNGHVTGFEIINGGTSGDFVILADKFLICKPDGTGTPKQVLILGTVNGVTALGLDGSLIVDGSIVARHLAVTSLDAITATIGTLRSAASGARLEVTTDVIRVYDSSGTLRVKMGNLA